VHRKRLHRSHHRQIWWLTPCQYGLDNVWRQADDHGRGQESTRRDMLEEAVDPSAHRIDFRRCIDIWASRQASVSRLVGNRSMCWSIKLDRAFVNAFSILFSTSVLHHGDPSFANRESLF
jgi:hypothetical protein